MYDDSRFKYELQARCAVMHGKPEFWRELTQPALEHLRRWSAKEYQSAHERGVLAWVFMTLLGAGPGLWFLIGPGAGESMTGIVLWTLVVLAVGMSSVGRARRQVAELAHLRILLMPLKNSPKRCEYVQMLTQLSSVREHRDAVLALGRELTEGDFVSILALGNFQVAREDAQRALAAEEDGLGAPAAA